MTDSGQALAERAGATPAVVAEVRRFDDAAKDPGAEVPGFAHYVPLLAGLLRPAPAPE